MVVVIVDMVAMFHIIPYWCYPYVIPTFHVVIIHRLFFIGGFMVIGWVANIFFLPYRGEPRRMLYQKEKLGHFEKLLFLLVVM